MKHINDNILNVCPKIIRRLDKWGRIILPKEFRNKIDSDNLKIDVDYNFIILSKALDKDRIIINENGRITIPKKIRKNLKWEEKDLIDIYLYENDYIVMKKTEIQCICYE